MAVSVRSVDLDIEREPLVQPFGFKGGSFREKWLCRATLKSASEREATGIGGLAVLWSDDGVCASHTEVGGNLLMAAMLEFGLQAAAGKTFSSPAALLGELSESVFEYGRTITARPNLRKTFAYNALVALDNAAWLLQAREQGVQSFDQMIPSACRAVLGHRHERLIVVPAVSYSTGMDEIHRLVEEGHGILKVKLGAPGDRSEMLQKDRQRLAAIHAAVGALDSPLGDGEPVRYYLDANGRYRSRADVEALLQAAGDVGALEQILLFEEPFPEDAHESLRGLPVRFAADESLHDVADVARKQEQGFTAVALKPAGKTLSLTLAMAAEAERLGMACFVADSSCLPRALDWNKNVAARLAPLPEVGFGFLESNGPDNYGHRRWQQLLSAHPCAPAPWLHAHRGQYHLDASFYESGGGIFEAL